MRCCWFSLVLPGNRQWPQSSHLPCWETWLCRDDVSAGALPLWREQGPLLTTSWTAIFWKRGKKNAMLFLILFFENIVVLLYKTTGRNKKNKCLLSNILQKPHGFLQVMRKEKCLIHGMFWTLNVTQKTKSVYKVCKLTVLVKFPCTSPSAYSSDLNLLTNSMSSPTLSPSSTAWYFWMVDQRECSRIRSLTSLRRHKWTDRERTMTLYFV